jgi:hypothetical protein
MRKWNLRAGDPLSLFLAADARMSATDYLDDQIWELLLSGGEAPAMAVETMLGLRAVSLRLFPVFVLGHHPVSDPERFFSPPTLLRFAPNYIQTKCAPFAQIEADCEYWVPESHSLAGRITFQNIGSSPAAGELWWAATLRPSGEGSAVHVESSRRLKGDFLIGEVGNLSPVVVLAGEAGAVRLTFSALKAPFLLLPGEYCAFRWAYAGLPSWEEGLAKARQYLEVPWDAAMARVEMENASMLEIETGHPDWDAVIAFSQVTAMQAVMRSAAGGEHAFAVIGRTPDRGYSIRGDGSDCPPSWSGVNALELIPLVSMLANIRRDMAQDILQNFLAEDLPDARPGPAGQRSTLLCPPILAQILERALAGRMDPELVRSMLPALERAVEAWYAPSHDPDQDGAPEWERIDSLEPEALAIWSGEDGVAPQEADTPALMALLFGECTALARFAERCGEEGRAQAWKQRADSGRQILERMWIGRRYQSIDRVTHRSTRGRVLWRGVARERVRIAALLDPPERIVVRCEGMEGARPMMRIWMSGKDDLGRAQKEEIQNEAFTWWEGSGICSTKTVWSKIDTFFAEGLSPDNICQLQIPDLMREDLSNYLPLWNRAVPEERAGALFKRLEKKYGCPAGLRFTPNEAPREEHHRKPDQVWMLWTGWMIEAALHYGEYALAWEWMRRCLDCAAAGLRADKAIRSSYSPDGKSGLGPRNSMRGVLPVNVFLSALGVFPISGTQVRVCGKSAIPFPVVLRYKGMILRRTGDRVEVEFPGGEKKSAVGGGETIIQRNG